MVNPLLKLARQAKAPKIEEPDESLLKKAGRTALSGLAAVGNLLDVPGGMVRNTLAGKNPIAPLLDPFSSESRISGRDLLRKAGVVGRRDTWGNWGAGLAGEILLDPTTYLGPGALVKGAAAGLGGTARAAKAGQGLLRAGIPLVSGSGVELLTGARSVRAAELLGYGAEKVGSTKPMRMARQFLDSSVMGRATKPVQAMAQRIFGKQTEAHGNMRELTTGAARDIERSGLTTEAPLNVWTDDAAGKSFGSRGYVVEKSGQTFKLFGGSGAGPRELGEFLDAASAKQAADEIVSRSKLPYTHSSEVLKKTESGLFDPDQAAEALKKSAPSSLTERLARYDALKNLQAGVDTLPNVLLKHFPERDLVEYGVSKETLQDFADEILGDRLPEGADVKALEQTFRVFPEARAEMVTGIVQLAKELDYIKEPLRRQALADETLFDMTREIDELADAGEYAAWEPPQPKVTPGLTPEASVELRRQLEFPATGTSPQSRAVADRLNATRTRNKDLGLPGDFLDDVVPDLDRPGETVRMGYGTRHINAEIIKGKGARSPFGARSAEDVGRSQAFKGFAEGTEGVNKLFADPGLKTKSEQWGMRLDQARASGMEPKEFRKLRNEALKDVTDYIRTTHGDKIMAQFQPVARKGSLRWKVGNRHVWARTAPEGAVPVMKSRYEALAKRVIDVPEMTKHTVFPNDPLVDIEHHLISAEDKAIAATEMYDFLANASAKFVPGTRRNTTQLGSMLKGMGFDTAAASKQLADRMKITWIPAAARDILEMRILEMRIDKEIADDLLGFWPEYQVPKESGLLLNTLDSFTALFKAGVLTWPARYVRDVMSAAARNLENGWLDSQSFAAAHHITQGRAVSGLSEIAAVRKWVADRGLEMNDQNATEAVRQLYAAHVGSGHAHTDVLAPGGIDPQLESILERVPGRQPTTEIGSVGNVLLTAAGRKPGTSYKPWDVRGFSGRRSSKFGPVLAGDMVGRYTDTLARLPAFINRLKAGVEPAEAMRLINNAQVDYSQRMFTPHERVLKRIFPFYAFTKAQTAYLSKELLSNPGGRLATTIKTSAKANDPSEMTPDYVAETMSIPLGKLPDGSQRYITGLGLMHEDPLSFLGGGLRGAGLEALSRMNPLAKGPLEMATGQSFFQKGPEGGRPLEDLDPTVGRILANVTGRQKAVQLPSGLELALANSPLTRALTSARQVTDARKGPLAKATNLLTGIRVHDVSPAAQDALLRERAQQLLKGEGARPFTKVAISKEELSTMPPAQQERVKELQSILAVLAERAKQRKKDKR